MQGLLLLRLLGILLPCGLDLCGDGVAGVEDKSMVEVQTLGGFQRRGAIGQGWVVVVLGERIGGEKAVGTDVPARGMAVARGVIKNGYAQVLAIHRAVDGTGDRHFLWTTAVLYQAAVQ